MSKLRVKLSAPVMTAPRLTVEKSAVKLDPRELVIHFATGMVNAMPHNRPHAKASGTD